MSVLVVNAGSTSVKLRVVVPGEVVHAKDLEPDVDDLSEHLADLARRVSGLDAVGHRVVHGGPLFSSPVIVDDKVRADLETVSELAPLHNPPALAGIDAARRLFPDIPSVACFDTAFHAHLPAVAAAYAVPTEWVQRWGIRRYGFHGLSCAWASRRAAELTGRPLRDLRVVVCHLGGGASVTAVVDGRSVDTTMGFTPLEGLVMATRVGDLDPGALLWVLQHGVNVDDALDQLEHRSGLLGLTDGATSDMRRLLAARAQGHDAARLAIGVYVHRLRAKIASMAAAAGGIDVLVFTGGVGENASEIRSETGAGLEWMGISIARASNDSPTDSDRDISTADARARTLVVHAKEELQIAEECSSLLGGS